MNFSQKHKSYHRAASIQEKISVWAAGWLPKVPGLPCPPLEVGAGTGLFTKHLANQFPSLIASDLSDTMLAEGKTHCPTANWEVLDAWNLKDNRIFGGIFSSSLLQWCPSPLETFKNWYQHMAPDSWMLHTFFVEGTLRELEAIAPECIAVKFRKPGEWESSLESAGFEILQTEAREDFQCYPDAMAFFRNLHDLGATTPQKIRPAKLRGIIEQYNWAHRQGGDVLATWKTMKVLCQKPA